MVGILRPVWYRHSKGRFRLIDSLKSDNSVCSKTVREAWWAKGDYKGGQ